MGASCAPGHPVSQTQGLCCRVPRNDSELLQAVRTKLEETPHSDDLVWDDNGPVSREPDKNDEDGDDDDLPSVAKSTTFSVLNKVIDDANLKGCTESKLDGRSKEELLSEIETLVDVQYDILAAEVVFAELEASLGRDSAAWAEVVDSQLFRSFLRKLSFFHQIGEAYAQSSQDWFCVYQDTDAKASIHGQIDPSNKYILHYRVEVFLPASLANVIAVSNEIKLMPLWNPLAGKDPGTIGRVTAHYLVVNYQMRALRGLYQVDILNEVRRFSDTEAGFFAEYIQTCGKDHPSYKPPMKGYKRQETLIKNVWIACGSDCTCLTQMGTLTLPFPATKWVASSIGGVAGRYIIGGLVKNSSKTLEPDNPWLDALAKDVTGLYARLRQCVACAASQSRAGHENGRVNLKPYFERTRIQRTS